MINLNKSIDNREITLNAMNLALLSSMIVLILDRCDSDTFYFAENYEQFIDMNDGSLLIVNGFGFFEGKINMITKLDSGCVLFTPLDNLSRENSAHLIHAIGVLEQNN